MDFGEGVRNKFVAKLLIVRKIVVFVEKFVFVLHINIVFGTNFPTK